MDLSRVKVGDRLRVERSDNPTVANGSEMTVTRIHGKTLVALEHPLGYETWWNSDQVEPLDAAEPWDSNTVEPSNAVTPLRQTVEQLVAQLGGTVKWETVKLSD